MNKKDWKENPSHAMAFHALLQALESLINADGEIYLVDPNEKRQKTFSKNKFGNGLYPDEILIRQIAEDTGCKNEQLIRDVCEYYKEKEIYLI